MVLVYWVVYIREFVYLCACGVCVYVNVIMCIYGMISIAYNNNYLLDVMGTILNVIYMYVYNIKI